MLYDINLELNKKNICFQLQSNKPYCKIYNGLLYNNNSINLVSSIQKFIGVSYNNNLLLIVTNLLMNYDTLVWSLFTSTITL